MLSFSKGLDGKVTVSDNSKIIAPIAKQMMSCKMYLIL